VKVNAVQCTILQTVLSATTPVQTLLSYKSIQRVKG